MNVLELSQGSQEWHAARARHFCASEAPAALGASKYMTRSELLHQKHTGIAADVDAATQRRFDSGHAAEVAARAIVQQRLGEDLYPVTGTLEVEGLPLLASFDGLTITDDLVWETKLLSNGLLSQVQAGELEPHYYWQLEQQLLVSGAEKAYFTTSDGTEEGTHGLYYESKPERRAALIAGWKQFAEDLKNYTPPASVPVVVAEPVQALPAVMVQVSGEISIKDNFKAFETALRDFLDHRLIREPKTDQDFADLDVQIKAMKGAEEALSGAEAQMLAQVQSIDQAKKTRDMLGKLVRDNRLMAEKLLASEKERRKGEIVAGGVAEFAKYMTGLNERLGKPYMPAVPVDFGGAVKGLKSMSSMEDKVATELARAKIAASEIADRLQKNLDYLRDNAADFKFLFADTASIIQKAPDDLQALVQNRITQHKAEEAAKEERIREEAAAKARQKLLDEQAAAQKAEDALISSIWANARRIEGNSVGYIQKAIGMFETAAKDFENDLRPRVVAAITEARAEMTAKLEAAQQAGTAPAVVAALTDALVTGTGVLKQTADTSGMTLTHVPAAALRVNPVPAAANDDAVINVGEINDRIKPLQISAAGLQELGFQPVPRKGAGVFFRESDYPRICEALIQHLTQVADLQVAA